jgi:hypothetical protein
LYGSRELRRIAAGVRRCSGDLGPFRRAVELPVAFAVGGGGALVHAALIFVVGEHIDGAVETGGSLDRAEAGDDRRRQLFVAAMGVLDALAAVGVDGVAPDAVAGSGTELRSPTRLDAVEGNDIPVVEPVPPIVLCSAP